MWIQDRECVSFHMELETEEIYGLQISRIANLDTFSVYTYMCYVMHMVGGYTQGGSQLGVSAPLKLNPIILL